jgi:hypothetical protein
MAKQTKPSGASPQWRLTPPTLSKRDRQIMYDTAIKGVLVDAGHAAEKQRLGYGPRPFVPPKGKRK